MPNNRIDLENSLLNYLIFLTIALINSLKLSKCEKQPAVSSGLKKKQTLIILRLATIA